MERLCGEKAHILFSAVNAGKHGNRLKSTHRTLAMSAPRSAAVESKIPSVVVVFLRELSPPTTCPVFRIFEPALLCHHSPVCLVW